MYSNNLESKAALGCLHCSQLFVFSIQILFSVIFEQLQKSYFHYIFRTAIGVESFKNGDHEKALKYLNHALKIYEENSEALVARGAL